MQNILAKAILLVGLACVFTSEADAACSGCRDFHLWPILPLTCSGCAPSDGSICAGCLPTPNRTDFWAFCSDCIETVAAPVAECGDCPGATTDLTMGLSGNQLSLSGSVTGGNLALTDPLRGAAITFSGTVSLSETVSLPDVSAALFLPAAPVTVSIGGVVSGDLMAVIYTETASRNSVSVSIFNPVAGPSASPFFSQLQQINSEVIGFAGTSSTPLFGSITGGSLSPTLISADFTTACPEPSTVSTTIAGALLAGVRAMRRRKTA